METQFWEDNPDLREKVRQGRRKLHKEKLVLFIKCYYDD